MAVRLDEKSIVSGEISNLTKGKIKVRLKFSDGFNTEISLLGNTKKDIAGRRLTIQNQHADLSLQHDEAILVEDHGSAGDITAARKVKQPTIPLSEVGDYYSRKQKIPYVWKNSLYLEWFSHHCGRVVLEASHFQMQLSEAEWEMTETEELATQQAARDAMTEFLDQLGDLEGSRQKIDRVIGDKEELDEFDWEKMMRHSDKVTNRYMELLDKYEDDDEKISELMGWNTKPDHEEVFGMEMCDFNEADWSGDDDWGAVDEHPLKVMTTELQNAIKPNMEEKTQAEHDLWFSVAMISAKLAGALSGYHRDGTFDDKGFAIAQLKRVLVYVNESIALMQKDQPERVPDLMLIRQGIIDLQQELRR